jgi:predicted ATPase
MARLTGIYLKNFQAIREPVFLNLEKLTFLLGPNSVGKSAIYDAFDLIQKIVNRENLSSIESIFNRYTPAGKVSVIGIEIETSSSCFAEDVMPFSIYNSCRDWWNTKDRVGDYSHNDFFRKLKNKKIQIEFSDKGNSIKIAVDGQSLVECEYNSHWFLDNYQVLEIKDNRYEDLGIDALHISSVYIPSKSLLNEKKFPLCKGDMFYNEKALKNSNLYNLFVEKHESYRKYKGITHSESSEFRLELELQVGWTLFESRDRLQSELKDKLKEYQKSNDENLKSYIERLKNIIESDFDNDEKKSPSSELIRECVFSGLQSITTDLSLIMQGFYYLTASTLRLTHISGSRGIIDSEIATIDETKQDLSMQNAMGQNPLLGYARNLCRWYSDNLMDDNGFGDIDENDYVNLAIKKFMPSIKNYRIIPESYSVMYQNLKFIEDIHKWMWKDKPKIIHMYILNPTGNKLNLRDVGSGIGFILPILASLSESELSFIEQPELHLHPSAQCEIGDVFISALNRGNRAIIESHSEYILLRILRRIRETHNGYLLPKELKIKPEDINIYYFKPTAEGTRIKHIRVDAFGEFMDRFPDGFFPERDIELFGGMEPFNE